MHSSGKNSPCPMCDRVKDGDCRWNDDELVLCHTIRDGVVPKGHRHPERPFIYCGESDEAQGFGKWLPEHLDDPSKKAPRKPRERFWVYRCWDGTDFPVRRKRTETPGKKNGLAGKTRSLRVAVKRRSPLSVGTKPNSNVLLVSCCSS